MLLGGLQKTTLIDFPGKIACTVFTVGCNFACPFCHNRELTSQQLFKTAKLQSISQKDFFNFLANRQKLLDGVCISGGEPTIFPQLPEFIKKIKKMGFLVKLDTNGSHPEMLAKIIQAKLVDYIAMDLKNDLQNYDKAIGKKTNMVKIKESIKLISKAGIDYEFRTTIVPGIHDLENLTKLAKQLKKLNVGTIWFWQNFRAQNCLDEKFLRVPSFDKKKLERWLVKIKKVFPRTQLRNLD